MEYVNPDRPLSIPGLQHARCLEQALGPRDRAYLLEVSGRRCPLSEAYVLCGDGHNPYRVHRAAVNARAHAQFDLGVLGLAGFDEAWRDSFGKNAELLYHLWVRRQQDQAVADIGPQTAQCPLDEADALLGEALRLVRGGNIHWALSIPIPDRQSLEAREQALVEFNAKAALPELRKALLGCGISEAALQRLGELQAIVHGELQLRAERAARLSQDGVPLRILKGVLIGDLTILASTARAKLPEPRRELYQLSTLLDLPERRPELAPAPTPAPVLAAPMQSVADHVLPAVPMLGFKWPPGTVVYSAPVRNGPSIQLVAQEDGSLAWVPAGAPPAAPMPVQPRGAVVEPQPPVPLDIAKPERQPPPRRTRRR